MAANNIKFSGRKTRKNRLASEINITPMVDVMLVLLIIFMVTSPMLVAGVEVDLPQTQSSPISGNDKPIIVSVDKNGNVFILETRIISTELASKLRNIIGEHQDKNEARIFVRGDKNTAYGKIVETMAEIKNAGFTKVALISDIKHK